MWLIKWEKQDDNTVLDGYLLIRCDIRQLRFKPTFVHANKDCVTQYLFDSLTEYCKDYPLQAESLGGFEMYACLASKVQQLF
jgi:hypothetical protein